MGGVGPHILASPGIQSEEGRSVRQAREASSPLDRDWGRSCSLRSKQLPCPWWFIMASTYNTLPDSHNHPMRTGVAGKGPSSYSAGS